jgi:hypothetical protein
MIKPLQNNHPCRDDIGTAARVINLGGSWVCPRAGLDAVYLPRRKLPPIAPPAASCYTDWAITAHCTCLHMLYPSLASDKVGILWMRGIQGSIVVRIHRLSCRSPSAGSVRLHCDTVPPSRVKYRSCPVVLWITASAPVGHADARCSWPYQVAYVTGTQGNWI